MITLVALVVLTIGLMVALRREGARLERVAAERALVARLARVAPAFRAMNTAMSRLGVSASEAAAGIAAFGEALKKASRGEN